MSSHRVLRRVVAKARSAGFAQPGYGEDPPGYGVGDRPRVEHVLADPES